MPAIRKTKPKPKPKSKTYTKPKPKKVLPPKAPKHFKKPKQQEIHADSAAGTYYRIIKQDATKQEYIDYLKSKNTILITGNLTVEDYHDHSLISLTPKNETLPTEL